MPCPTRELTEYVRRSIAGVGIRETARRLGIAAEQVVSITDGLPIHTHALTTAATMMSLEAERSDGGPDHAA